VVARQLVTTGHVSPDAYTAAQRLLGDAGLVELVALCGYYSLISYLLNAFDVPLPPGAEPAFAPPATAAPAGPAPAG
jgi:4-carboxymuconolactone decarboxylase